MIVLAPGILTGVCKINGVFIVVNCCYSIGFTTTNNNINTVYFPSTGMFFAVIVIAGTGSAMFVMLVTLNVLPTTTTTTIPITLKPTTTALHCYCKSLLSLSSSFV